MIFETILLDDSIQAEGNWNAVKSYSVEQRELPH